MLLADLAALAGIATAIAGAVAGLVAVEYARRRLWPQRIQQEQAEFVAARKQLNKSRSELSRRATEISLALARKAGDEAISLGQGLLVSKPEWIAEMPVPLGMVSLRWADADEPKLQPPRWLPRASRTKRFQTYTEAMEALCPPALFEDWPSYRILGINGRNGSFVLTCGGTTYFRMLDICEALAHELSNAQANGEPFGGEKLPLRRSLGSPFDLEARPVIPSINVLTLRRDGSELTFFLHHRDPDKVAVAGGSLHIAPAGVFQPGSVYPGNPRNDPDFDMWRSIMREYAEEYLGVEETQRQTGFEVDYENDEPYASLSRGRAEGAVHPLVLGFAIDPLTWCVETLMVTVIDAWLFDRVFADLRGSNPEGELIGMGQSATGLSGRPFSTEEVNRLLTSAPLLPAAAGCLELASRHEKVLRTLGDQPSSGSAL